MLQLILFLIFLSSPPLLIHSLNQEGLFLHQLTTTLSSSPTSSSPFTNWNLRDATPCNWTGVTCDPSTSFVTAIDLSEFNLSGPFPTLLCRLSNLTSISLYNNYINSHLPPDISACSSLQHLNLAQNLLTDQLPPTLADLPNLKYLDLGGNNFSGDVPAIYGRFPKLQVISLIENLLDGDFPMVLANISTLKQLNLSYNPFKPSQLGPEIGNLPQLELLWLAQCNLVGHIPEEIGNLKNLKDLDLAMNSLSGSIPSTITGLSSIVQIELYNNSLNGSIPAHGWAELKDLRMFDASMNQLTGSIPDELTRLPLSSFSVYENRLEGQVPASVADSPNLSELKLFSNKLTGPLPTNLGEKSPLVLIDVTGNNLSGEIPPNLCAKGVLEELLLLQNKFSGAIPSSLGECRSLTRIRLSSNKLSGQVPDSFWGLPHVSLLELSGNSLSGRIPKTIATATNLSMLVIWHNNFTGEIPDTVGSLNRLVGILAGGNQFSGSLPPSIVELEQLVRLDLHGNHLSGVIPGGIRSWKKLNDLNLADNMFSGPIPPEIGSLSLNYLDLSSNQLSGKVPDELQNLKLNQLNLSNNQLSGKLPSLFAKETYKSSFLGNPGLCGDIPGLCDSAGENGEERGRGYMWLLRSIFILAALVFIVGVAWFYWRYRNFKNGKRSVDRSKWTLMSFHKLGFSEYEILDCLDEDNVIGSGASGKVYKAILSSGEAVAVKKLWGPSKKTITMVAAVGGGDIGPLDSYDAEKGQGGGGYDDGFEAEVETLGKIRHKNIVRLWCCCSTKDCKLLVYEYMPNGSLGDLLHSSKGGLLLDWPNRYKIALDAAEGLSYLHHDCVPAIVHRDVKSNNILLDGEFGAKVADFGVAKVVDITGKGTKSMSVIAGSCGYIAPEYAYTLRVNEKSDTYSFGVVILELVTGKKPIDPRYGEKDLVKWVCTTLDQKGVDHVVDPKLESCFKEEICKFLNIGLLCTSPLPINRPSMRRVVKMLQEVAGENMMSKSGGKKDGRLTPYYYEENSDHGSVV